MITYVDKPLSLTLKKRFEQDFYDSLVTVANGVVRQEVLVVNPSCISTSVIERPGWSGKPIDHFCAIVAVLVFGAG